MAEFKIPGVYSEIDASAALRSLSANDYVIGVVAKGGLEGDINLVNKAYAPYSFEDAIDKFGKDSNIIKIMDAASVNGATKFIVVRVLEGETNPDYNAALDILAMEEAVDIVLTDAMDLVTINMVKTHVNNASSSRKERFSVFGYDTNTNISTAITNATSVNSPRMIAAYPNGLNEEGEELPGFITAAALAGQLAGETDPSMPMTGVEIQGFYGLAIKISEAEMESLIDAGIVPLEIRNGTIRIVRCITTYTKDANDAVDITWQEITTIRISDYIFKDLREHLARTFARAKQNADTRDALRSEVVSRLMQYQDQDYLENVVEDDVAIEINPTNPLRSDVKFKYDVTGPLNVIHLTGYLVI
jgi:phage tail sheath gpL-like